MTYPQTGGFTVGKQLNNGYAGNVSRSGVSIITNRAVQSTDTAAIPFGSPVVLNSNNTYSLLGATGTFAEFAGVAIREVQQATTYFPASGGSYQPGQPCDVIELGSVTVVCQLGTPTAGGAVYIRTALNSSYPNAVVGGFEAQADGTNSFLVTNAKWTTGYVDANSIAELTLITRNQP